MSMSYDGMEYTQKIDELCKLIKPHIQFASLTEATAVSKPHKLASNSDTARKLESMAQSLYDEPAKYGIDELLDTIGVDNANKCSVRTSALREAIVLCAQSYVNDGELVTA